MRARGFTLLETIFVIAVVAMCGTALFKIMPQVWKVQNESRDEYAGLAQMQACAERLLGIRRHVGLNSVTASSCSGMSGLGGFNAPTVTLVNEAGTTLSACDSAFTTCTATISIARSSGAAVSIPALTLQLRTY